MNFHIRVAHTSNYLYKKNSVAYVRAVSNLTTRNVIFTKILGIDKIFGLFKIFMCLRI